MVQLLLHMALPFKQRVHLVAGHRFAKLGIDLFKLFQQMDGLLYRFFHDLAHSSRIVDQRSLLQIADHIAWRDNGLAVKLLVHGRQYAQER